MGVLTMEAIAVQKLLFLALAGAAGTLARYGLAGAVQRLAGPDFPWGTLAVNVAGCFLAGLFWAWSQDRVSVSGETRVIVLMGFMGAFTTFSTFAVETSAMVRDSQWLKACGNMALHNGIGMVALFLGLATGRVV